MSTELGMKFSVLDWARLLFAVAVLVFGPSLGLMLVSDGMPDYEHTGWLFRLLLSIPATLLCALVLWPPVWLVCRRSQVASSATMFAVLYTPVAAFMFVGFANVALDREAGRRVTVHYVEHVVRSKGPSQDVISSWDDPTKTISLSSTLLRAEHRVAGAPVSLTVHRGFLGLEWVDHVEASN